MWHADCLGWCSEQAAHSAECMNFGFESLANLGETGSFVEVVGLITDINLARLRQCVLRIQNMMDKREKEVLKEKLLLAVENVKKSFNLFFLCHYFIFISLSWGHLLQVLPQCQNLQRPLLRTSAEDLQLQHAHKHIETSGIKRVATLFPSDES